MPYYGKLAHQFHVLHEWMDLKREQGADIKPLEKEIAEFIWQANAKVRRLKSPGGQDEPDDLQAIRKARPDGPRVLPYDLTSDQLYDKMLGAWLGRSAGCMLGIPVEGKNRELVRQWAEKLKQPYPLTEYFKDYPGSSYTHYSEPADNFVKGKIDHVGPDDDLAYTVLGLLILEDYGIDFTPEDVGKAWLKYLPMACTAEKVALDNLKAGLQPPKTAIKHNPYCEWIGADIRSDPWGYCAPGLPEKAAEFAWRDARVSHLRNGIYGEMFFSAAIAAAFVEDDIRQVLNIALSEIPARSRMAKTVKQTMKWCHQDGDWSATHNRVINQYAGMSNVHTLNNAALTIMGLLYGEGDFEKTISLTVMGGLDTDCTGATAGSIAGTMIGAKKLPKKWINPFNDKLTTYIIGHEKHKISQLAKRCCKIAAQTRKRVESET